jgi:spermidine synthase
MTTPPLAAILLLAAAALGYEILLTRLFSIVAWHHFAYMIISVAMLGYGAAGTLVALTQRVLAERFAAAFIACALAFWATSIGGFLLAQRVAFNPLEILWDPRQTLRLAAVYALLFVPFFCAATCICLAFTRFPAAAHRIYAFDIVGAGLGCLAALALLHALSAQHALLAIGALGGIAGLSAARRAGYGPGILMAVAAGVAIAVLRAGPADWTRLRLSEYKELAQALAVDGTRIVGQRSGPLGVITVVESPRVPFRYAPGASLVSAHEPPPQLGVFTDGDAMSALVKYDGRREPLAYLDDLTSALPYHLRPRPRVLVLGAGAGADVLQAIAHDAAAIDAVELNRQIVDLVETQFAEFSGRPYRATGVELHIDEARRFVAGGRGRYDIVQVALLDAFGASAAGLHALAESYLYTVEALQDYLRRLTPDGVVAITRWVNLPPRDMIKMMATAIAALEREGAAEPGTHLALVRGWRTATLLVGNRPFSERDVAAMKAFSAARAFDLDWYPGIRPQEANRRSVLEQSWFHDGAAALLGPDREGFLDRYKFDVAPATDDRPYFFHFFKWRTLPEVLALKERGGLPLLEWGYPVLVATFVQAIVIATLLVLLPLAVAGGAPGVGAPGVSRARVGAYFLALGGAFMFVEIAFIQKFILFLGHPLYAVAVVLFAFLVFAGFGGRYAGRRQPATAPPRTATGPAMAIGIIALAYLVAMPAAFPHLVRLPDSARVAVAIALIAPLAFAMGMPFPRGIKALGERAPALVPWAWGMNACASVVAAVGAALFAVQFGFNAVVAAAVAMYGVAAWVGRRWLAGN